jgi:hypothetical protein
MIFKTRLYSAACLLSMATLAPFTAKAGQLFPPENIGQNPNVVCPHGMVLDWTGNAVTCTDPTPGVSVSCPSGQLMTAITYGRPTCVPQVTVPNCGANQYVTANGATFSCANLPASPDQPSPPSPTPPSPPPAPVCTLDGQYDSEPVNDGNGCMHWNNYEYDTCGNATFIYSSAESCN